MKINRGDVWIADLNPVVGSEIAKIRPVLVISHNSYNTIADTITIIPISTGKYVRSFHVFIKELKEDSHALIPQIRIASKKRFVKKICSVSEQELAEVKEKLLRYLDLRK